MFLVDVGGEGQSQRDLNELVWEWLGSARVLSPAATCPATPDEHITPCSASGQSHGDNLKEHLASSFSFVARTHGILTWPSVD